ncbi:hypothetical protein [Corynebacterium mastitidis]
MRTRLARLFNLAWLIAVALPSFGTAREVMDKQYYSLAPALGGLLMAAVIATLWAVRTVFSTRPDRFVTRTFLVFAPLYALEVTLYIGGREWIAVLFWLAVAFMLLVSKPRFFCWARGLSRRRRVA